MPAPKELNPDAGPLAYFGYELRKLRENKGWSQEQLAKKIRFSPSYAGQVERATRRPSRDFVERCEKALGLEGELLRLLPSDSTVRWFRSWLEVEQEATSIRLWGPLIVPGLLQTEDYARSIIGGLPGITQDRITELTSLRMARQQVLQKTTPPMLWIVLDECVLIRPVGGAEVMRQQLEHLLEAVESPRISVQIAPLGRASTTGLLGAFSIAQLPNKPEMAYLQSANTGHVTDRNQVVRDVTEKYETIRSDALPRQESLNMIKEMIRKWTT
ncbi:Scr1 family TA system antitoxin-like transcriptional regulator [Streptosporangium sp. NPDC049376]|uniref:helix-turn-helix domain-containing protein n=1 Tax=Streptosporangium sp. NPDC049376 TaxID=3366192 RepID=UPI00378B7012